MRLAQTLRYVFVGLVFAAMPLSAQNPIKFHTANNTVFTDSLQSLYVDLCLGAFHDTSGVHRSGKMYLDVTLNDGGLATTCSGGTGTNLVSDLSLKPGVNYFVVEVTDWNWTVYRDSILVTYQLPAGTGGAPYVIAPAEGGLRLMPGEERTMTFVVTNVSQDTTDFDVTLSCTGGLSSCYKVGGGSQFTTASLLPGTSESVQVRATASTSPGTGTFRFIAEGGLVDTGTTAVSISRDPLPSVKVSRMADTLVRAASATHTAYFQVSNPDHFASRYVTPSLDCQSTTPCSVSPSFINLGAGRDTMVKVTFASPSSGHRKIKLTASTSDGATAGKDSMWVKAGTALAGAFELTALEPRPRTSTARGECLSIAAGPGAGVECGALRLVYAFPAVTSMNKTRSLRLVYLSDHAQPFLSIPIRVRIKNRSDSLALRTTVAIGGFSPQDTIAWDPSCTLPSGCVLNARVNADALNLATGDYAYTVTVEALGGGFSAQVSGTAVIVNRKASPYGPGWWLEGVEQLMVSKVDSTRRVWIGGDGSTRRFKPVGGGIYIAEDTVAHSERLLRAGSGTGETWTREIRGGAKVTFDYLRRHVRTVNRQRDTTAFDYVGSSVEKVSAVRPPIAGIDTLRISLRYNGAMMDTVRVPAGLYDYLPTYIRRNGTRISAIVEATGDSIVYNYAGASLVPNERLDRLGKSVRWEYSVAGRVARVAAALGTNDTVATRLCTAETRALAACAIDGSAARAVAASRYRSILDGPRPDSDARDVSQFYVGRFGAVDSIVDPYGARTRIFREDAQSPALATRVIDPAGITSKTVYAQGRPVLRVVEDQWSSGSRDTTIVSWDTTWNVVTEQRSPSGRLTRQGVDASTGNILWQASGSGESTKVHMKYDSRNRPTQVFTVRPFSTDTTVLESYTYSGKFGNLTTTITGTGQRTFTWLDDAGTVDSLESTLVGPGACHATTNPCVRQHFRRDLARRVLMDSTISPAVDWSINPESSAPFTGSAPSLLGLVATTYDKEGRPLTVARWTPGPEYAASSATSTFRYDALGRQTSASIGGAFDTTTYDKAGNAVRIRTRNGHIITQTFDALGRVTSRTTPEVRYPKTSCTTCWQGLQTSYTLRIPYYQTRVGPAAYSEDVVIPSETAVFAYDAAGRMVQADNPLVRVRRGYYPNGALKADTSEMRAYNYTETNSGFSGLHRTFLTFEYDREGRRLKRTDSSGGVQTYGYDALGQLAWTRDSVPSQQSRRATFSYDYRGNLIQQAIDSSNFVDTWAYDAYGRAVSRTGNFVDSMEYDIRGKRTRVDGRLTYPDGPEIVMTAAYDGFGNLVATGTTGDAIHSTDEFQPDALGNSFRRFGNRGQAMSATESATESNFSGGKLMSATGLPYPTPADSNRTGPNDGPPVQAYDELALQYDAAGNVKFQSSYRHTWVKPDPGYPGYWIISPTGHSFTWTFYDADARPRFVQRHVRGTSPASPQTTYHEYWYDALGRRVLVRDRSDSTSCGTSSETAPVPCQQAIVRSTWDGSQLLREKRSLGGWHLPDNGLEGSSGPTPWFGTRRYTHAGDIDAPVMVWLDDVYPRALVRNWRGSAAGAVLLHTCGGVGGCRADSTTVYPATRVDVLFSREYAPGVPEPNAWLGSLIDEQRDATGLLYRRNRYYDPTTGRFTQPDPIGLAGGLNLYWYGDGDPVNNSDPLGLCVGCASLAASAVQRRFEPYSTYSGSNAADFTKVSGNLFSALTLAGMQNRVKMGVYQATEGSHADPRHSGCSSASQTCDPALSGHAADVNEFWTPNGKVDIGTRGVIPSTPSVLLANAVATSLLSNPSVRAVIWPTGHVASPTQGGPRIPRAFVPGTGIWASHQSHLHISTYTSSGR
ncbi:MAG: RHS repeat-associated core domain-containing protein [Gemmatimonadaceae bacterium]|nr:RHS repeat-associated core domain-containing protein [Gemmatimonadaceae bacterium]